MRLAPDGTLLEETSYAIPGNELTMFSCIEEPAPDTFLIAGTTSFGCDFGPFLGLLVAWHDGAPIWTRTYGGEPGWSEFTQMAVGDSTVMLPMSDGLLLTTLEGDSLTWVSTGWLYIRSIRAIAGRFLVAGQHGLNCYEQDGTPAAMWTDSALFDVAGHPDGGYVALGSSGLYRFDALLNLIGGMIPLDLPEDGRNASIAWSDGAFQLIDDSLLRTVDADLNLISSLPFEHPDGYSPTTGLVDAGTAFTCGALHCGASAAAVRTMSTAGALPADPHDVAWRSMVPTDVVYTIYPSSMINYVNGTFNVDGWLVNLGTDTVEHTTLNQYLPWGICGPAGATYILNDLALAPGDSVLVSSGPFYLTAYVDTGLLESTQQVCIWAASPDERMDAHRADNQACALITMYLSIDDKQPLDEAAIFPNPFAQEIRIQGLHGDTPIEFDLMDARGKNVLHRRSLPTNGSVIEPVQGLASGMYILQLRAGHARRSFRLFHID